MIGGEIEVRRVFLVVFPSEAALARVLNEAKPGDFVFSHHPLDMRCGDPRGEWGSGFQPISVDHLDALQHRWISFYSVHAPMDVNRLIGTTAALVEALGGRYVGGFYPYGDGFAGAICDIDPISTCELAEKYEELLGIPYLHEEGPRHDRIERVAIIPGCGDHVPSMRAAAEIGAQAYLTGEVHCHIDNDYGRSRMAEMKSYIAETPMSLLGGSHAATEFLVMRTQMAPWFEQVLGLETVLVPEQKWWR
ncbi:hypothetical protein OP10G_3030 [Fimbriimonas ginsengisoli Gsoil 348]|uniref:GTP cyclohydrolase 1 type 2 homolog n=2 Tax=Fimbriimonas ginsengisoli TaxID=1005039 RepID=A0A068NS69_FIMGI|nr:hypothetical protein OP10G_3030 [Fimbriimonas ginsengisoli Gsoil 348]